MGRYAQKELLTESERKLQKLLEEALPEFRVMPQVAMNALLNPADARLKNSLSARRKFSQKVVDFVLEEKAGRKKVIVELDDPTHDSKEAARRDLLRDHMLRSAGYRTIRWDIRDLPGAEEIRKRVLTPSLDDELAPLPESEAAESSSSRWVRSSRESSSSKALAFIFALGLVVAFGWLLLSVVPHLILEQPRKLREQAEAKAVQAKKLEVSRRLDAEMVKLAASPECEKAALGASGGLNKLLASHCLVPELTRGFGFPDNSQLSRQERITLWNSALDAAVCPSHRQWALEIESGDATVPAKTEALQQLYADARAKGCLKSGAS